MFYYYNQSFIQETQKTKLNIQKKKLKEKYLAKVILFFGKDMLPVCINSKKLIHAYGPEKKVLIMPI